MAAALFYHYSYLELPQTCQKAVKLCIYCKNLITLRPECISVIAEAIVCHIYGFPLHEKKKEQQKFMSKKSN